MIYKEEVRDLFKVPQGYCLAHCIAADIGMGAGIATQFNEHYDMKNRLCEEFDELLEVGDAIKIDNVYNLITKEKSYKKPTYEDLTVALQSMKGSIKSCGVKKLAIPQIGCGLDGLNWDIVRAIIKEIFEDVDIEILVCIKPIEKNKEYDSYHNLLKSLGYGFLNSEDETEE